MSDALAMQVVTAVLTLIGTMFTGIMAYLMARLNTRQAFAAMRTEEVKDVLEKTTADSVQRFENLAKVAESTHTLVNSAMSVQLRATADALKKLCESSQATEADRAALLAAQQAYEDQQRKQAVVDEQPGTDAQKQGKER